MTPPGPGAIASLRGCFAGRLLTSPEEMAPFLTDWRRRWHGRAQAVAMPDTARDVAAILGWCHANRVPVVPQGGNTGLAGGSVPDGTGRAVVVSLGRLNRIRGIDAANNSLVAEAGCLLHDVQLAAERAGRLFPLSLAAEASCTIGGNLATNAGGVHVLRYGTARALCLGLEVATPSGEIWDGLRALRKNTAGLDLRDLFIGAEGTLGIITAAVLQLYPRPQAREVGYVAVPSPAAALDLLGLAQDRAGAGLTAFELMSEACLAAVLAQAAGARRPFAAAHPWYVLIEVSAWGDPPHAHVLPALLERAVERGFALDAVLAASEAQAARLWALREGISDAQAADGAGLKHDVALPLSAVPEFIAAADAAVARLCPGLRPGVFGHLGDGNVHYNVLQAAGPRGPAETARFLAQEAAVAQCVHDLVLARGGTVSAEHGLGVLRAAEALRLLPEVEVRMMRAVRRALDPNGIMNPGKGV